MGSIVDDILVLLDSDISISVSHASRSSNLVAHRLASFAFEYDIYFEWFTHATDFILDALTYDCIHHH